MKKGGSAVAGPIWNKFIIEAMNILPDEKFDKPNLEVDIEKVKPVIRGIWQGNENFFIDKISGKLATVNTPKETLKEKVVTNVHTILYWVNKNDIMGPSPTNPENDSQFSHWEIPIQNWWANNSYKYAKTTLAEKPNAQDDAHTDANKPVVGIVQPNTTTVYPSNQKIQLTLSNSGTYPLQKIDVFINDVYLGTSKYPFNFSFTPSDLENLKDINEIKIISYDTAYNSSETTSIFGVSQ